MGLLEELVLVEGLGGHGGDSLAKAIVVAQVEVNFKGLILIILGGRGINHANLGHSGTSLG